MFRTPNYCFTLVGQSEMNTPLTYSQDELKAFATTLGVRLYGNGRLYLAKRFRGPRLNDGRRKHAQQSMCLRANATYCDVYLYQR